MSPEDVYMKCLKEKKRIHELEPLIIKDPKICFIYARDIIKGRFKEGEKIIATHPEHSYSYVHNVIKGPFPLAHPIIFNSKWKYNYVNFLKSINYDLNEISEWLL